MPRRLALWALHKTDSPQQWHSHAVGWQHCIARQLRTQYSFWAQCLPFNIVHCCCPLTDAPGRWYKSSSSTESLLAHLGGELFAHLWSLNATPGYGGLPYPLPHCDHYLLGHDDDHHRHDHIHDNYHWSCCQWWLCFQWWSYCRFWDTAGSLKYRTSRRYLEHTYMYIYMVGALSNLGCRGVARIAIYVGCF